jgi:hypothetical protein
LGNIIRNDETENSKHTQENIGRLFNILWLDCDSDNPYPNHCRSIRVYPYDAYLGITVIGIPRGNILQELLRFIANHDIH